MDLEKLERQVKWSRVIAVLIGTVVIGAYSLNFYNSNLSPSTDSWGQFGDYIGGILNPIIAYLALYWLTQSVLLQKQELADTKQALRDSADAQTKQERHAEVTAKINANNALLVSYNADISYIRSNLEFVNSQLTDLRQGHPAYSTLGVQLNYDQAQSLLRELNSALQTTLNNRMEIFYTIKKLLSDNAN